MEAEVFGLVGAEKNAYNPSRSDYRCGYRPRRLDTRVGTMYSHGAQTSEPRIHPILRYGTQMKRSSADPSYSGSVRTGRVHPEDGKAGSQSGNRKSFPQSSKRNDKKAQ
jgi:hypothetical protein